MGFGQNACSEFKELAREIQRQTGVEIGVSALEGMELMARGGGRSQFMSGDCAEDWQMNCGFVFGLEYGTFTSISQLADGNPALLSKISACPGIDVARDEFGNLVFRPKAKATPAQVSKLERMMAKVYDEAVVESFVAANPFSKEISSAIEAMEQAGYGSLRA